MGGADLSCKLLSKERGFLQVFALGLSFSGSNPPASVWISRLGRRELCLLQISLSVPSEASRISGLISKSTTKKKQMQFLLWTRRHDRGERCTDRRKGNPGHSKGLGITEGPREELDSRLLGMQENGPGSGADSLLG